MFKEKAHSKEIADHAVTSNGFCVTCYITNFISANLALIYIVSIWTQKAIDISFNGAASKIIYILFLLLNSKYCAQ